MLKVEKTKQKTIDPKDLTDKHFIGVVFEGRYKGFVMRLCDGKYITCGLTNYANTNYDEIIIFKSINELIKKSTCNPTFFATLDYEEFKDWFFKQ